MKLTSLQALDMLENFKEKTKNDRWIYHSICVGNSAGKIAKALQLDEEKAKVLGYIHDIGKSFEKKGHVINGYYFLKELGIDEEYANICLTHSFLNNDYLCTAGGIPEKDPFLINFLQVHHYTIYEKIINLCDLMCTNVNLTLEKRLIEIMVRRGVHPNTVYHITEAQKLKKEFDKMLGFNVYQLFPDVINH